MAPREKGETLVVHEIYASIQGESSFAGQPCTFVRLTGCNLRCRWCDTPQAFHGGTRMTRAGILARVDELATPLVELTGGEPLLQPGSPRLLEELCDTGKTVLLETSGERDISAVDPRVHRIVDFKAPGSGETARNRWENLAHLTHRDEVKLVLAGRADYEWARALVEREGLSSRVLAVHLSCAWGELEPRTLAAWMVEDGVAARLQLQMHKFLWGPDATGV